MEDAALVSSNDIVIEIEEDGIMQTYEWSATDSSLIYKVFELRKNTVKVKVTGLKTFFFAIKALKTVLKNQ